MNILFQTSISPLSKQAVGGAETSMRFMAELLSERGHSLCWISRFSTKKLWFSKKVEFSNKTKVYSYSSARGGSLKFINKYNQNELTKFVKKIILNHKIEVLYCYYDKAFLTNILRIRKSEGLNFKIVMRMAGLYWYEQCLVYPEMIPEYEYIFNEIDSVNYIHSSLETLVKEKFEELEMKVNFKHIYYGDIGSAVRMSRKKTYQNLPDNEFLMVMATRFSNYQKRQDILVEALSKVDKNIPFRLLLIGDGSERERIAQMIVDLNLSDRITIEPFLEQNQLWNKLMNAHLLCHACEYEGLSKIILESMSIGLPVLTSNVLPMASYITEGENGFLVNNTAEEWARKIEKIYSEKEKLSHISQKSIAFIDEYYNPQINVVKYEKYFAELVCG